MSATFATLGSTRLHFQVHGRDDAPALVLSNSLGTDLTMWAPQVRELARRFRVVLYDTRGHGESDVTPGPYTIEQLGRDVLGLLDVLGIERAHFCGLSLGGLVGMWLGVHAGYRIDRLVVANTAAKIGTAEMWDARIGRIRDGGMSAVAEAVLGRCFTPAFITGNSAPVVAVRRMLETVSPVGYVACCEAIRDADLRALLPRIGRRTLVISGAHDIATGPDDMRFIAQQVPGARFVSLAAAHLSNLEAPDAFTQALLEFLDIASV